MTLREATALILLYRACRDEALLKRARELVPELGEFTEPRVTGFILTAYRRNGEVIDSRAVICQMTEIGKVTEDYAHELGPGVYRASYAEAP